MLDFRHIYSLSTTGMHNYTTSREKYTKIPKDKLIKFRQKISDTVDDKNEQSLIFSEDLLEMMHIAEPTDSDLTLINKMLIKLVGIFFIKDINVLVKLKFSFYFFKRKL